MREFSMNSDTDIRLRRSDRQNVKVCFKYLVSVLCDNVGHKDNI